METRTEGEAKAKGAAKSTNAIPCMDPATLESLGDVPVVPAEEVRARVERARRAQRVWARVPFVERRRVLARILQHVLDHADELVDLICRDSGKTRENALLGEIWPVCEKLRHTIAHGERDLRPERVSSGLLAHKRATIEYHPLGVIGIICPWNFPLQNVLGPTVPALMAGNACVVKVSEWTSWSAPRIQRIFDEAFRDYGYPVDVVQIVTGYAETGAALVSGGVDKVVFTGSMPNGRRVVAESANTLTPVILELGGKDPMIVCDDASIEQAVHAAMAGVFITSGQMCLAAERVIVFDHVHDVFVEKVVELASKLRQGPPLAGDVVDVGAMTMPHQVGIVEKLVEDAVKKGATVRVGGKRNRGLGGNFFEPTVLTGVTRDMAIAQEETFGPVLCVFRIRDEEEAVKLANDTHFGLGSTVFTKDARRGKRIADQIRAGSTVVNDFGLAYMAHALPFGGVKGSGFGRLNGREGIRAMCNVKAVMTDRFPFSRPTKLYPVKPGDYVKNKVLIELIYRSELFARFSSAVELAKQLLRK
jgi:acyl-CoA reductase-like NAD-dependent aldehyde dehydrogenase